MGTNISRIHYHENLCDDGEYLLEVNATNFNIPEEFVFDELPDAEDIREQIESWVVNGYWGDWYNYKRLKIRVEWHLYREGGEIANGVQAVTIYPPR